MNKHLASLKPEERWACGIAERVLGAVAEPWDVAGRQGAVDAMLTLPDGQQAAFEVITMAGEGVRQTSSLLGRDGWEWPSVGAWWWTIQVGSPADIPRLRESHSRIIRLCESVGATAPEQLWHRNTVDPDIAWLVEESASNMLGHPSVPTVEGPIVRKIMVTPTGVGGSVDQYLIGLRQALADAFQEPTMAKHLLKVARAEAQERHLFIPLHYTALPFPVADGLASGTTLPPEPPPLPTKVTHLWLAPSHGRRVLLWNGSGWQQHYPYDN